MKTIDGMMPILAICPGQGSKMNFLVLDYIRVDTANLTLHHLWGRSDLDHTGCLIGMFLALPNSKDS